MEDGDYGTKSIHIELTPTERFIVDLLGTVKRAGIDPAILGQSPGTLEQLASKFERVLAPILGFDDPKGVYAHCLCRFE